MHERSMETSCANVRELVMTYGWNTTAYQILNPGFDYWFARSVPGVVAYTRRRNVLVVAGAPVCPHEALAAAAAEFERFASGEGCRVCYVCAADRLRETMHWVGQPFEHCDRRTAGVESSGMAADRGDAASDSSAGGKGAK
jgi:lysylphosphatidylglycerol synthetase-like protein (DUF2156 family)